VTTACVDQLVNAFRYRPQQIPPPWDDDWKLDEGFFKDLADWDNQHQESTFLKVLERIRDATIMCKPFTELIPNEPFPARALVLALSHFLHLGVVRSIIFLQVDSLSELIADRVWHKPKERSLNSWMSYQAGSSILNRTLKMEEGSSVGVHERTSFTSGTFKSCFDVY
jgi:hypothetical protein